MELDPEKKRIIESLNYRIQVSSDDDPEKENAKRLLDRLLKKYGITLDAINARQKREFIIEAKYKQIAIQLAVCLFPLHLHKKDIYEFTMYNYRKPRAWHKYDQKLIEMNLTSDEYKLYEERLQATIKFYDSLKDKFNKDLEDEIERRKKAFDHAFFEKANLLRSKIDEEDEDTNHFFQPDPGFGLREAMKAAEFLDDYVFPDHMIKKEAKLLENK